MGHAEQKDSKAANYSIPVDRYLFAIEHLGKNKKIVDLGCGMGYGTKMIADAGNIVVGVDRTYKAIQYAQEHYPGMYIQADLEMVNTTGFDAVVCLETLCSMIDPWSLIKRINVKEIVASSAIDPNPNDGYKWRLHNLSEEDFKKMFLDWDIKAEYWQKKSYLTIYATRKTE